MNIKRVGNVILAVKDLERSLKFYNEVLGLPIKRKRDNWIDLGQTGALLSLHPASTSEPHTGTSYANGIIIGFVVGDVTSAVSDLRSKDVKIHRDVEEHPVGKNAIILDPDEYMISLFEPIFIAEKEIQTGGYIGFTPALLLNFIIFQFFLCYLLIDYEVRKFLSLIFRFLLLM